MAKNVIAGKFDSAIGCSGVAEHSVVAGIGQALALGGVVERFHSLNVLFPSRVVMNADEDGAGIAVGDGGALGQGDEGVVVPDHHGTVTFFLEVIFQTHRGIEREMLFVDLPEVTSNVAPAVACINDDGLATEDAEETGSQEDGDSASKIIHKIINIC